MEKLAVHFHDNSRTSRPESTPLFLVAVFPYVRYDRHKDEYRRPIIILSNVNQRQSCPKEHVMGGLMAPLRPSLPCVWQWG